MYKYVYMMQVPTSPRLEIKHVLLALLTRPLLLEQLIATATRASREQMEHVLLAQQAHTKTQREARCARHAHQIRILQQVMTTLSIVNVMLVFLGRTGDPVLPVWWARSRTSLVAPCVLNVQSAPHHPWEAPVLWIVCAAKDSLGRRADHVKLVLRARSKKSLVVQCVLIVPLASI